MVNNGRSIVLDPYKPQPIYWRHEKLIVQEDSPLATTGGLDRTAALIEVMINTVYIFLIGTLEGRNATKVARLCKDKLRVTSVVAKLLPLERTANYLGIGPVTVPVS